MRVGIGLPGGVPGTDGHLMVEWARQAEYGPFSSLGVIDRVVYDSYDPLTALTAAAAVTRRLQLVSMIIIAPLRNPMLLAKQVASIDAISDGRLVLGVAVGARQDDYDAVGIEYQERGRSFTEMLGILRDLWDDPAFGPVKRRAGGPPLLIGGQSDQVFSRMARYGEGYVHGGGPPKTFARAAAKALAAWSDMRRPGRPQLRAQAYFALGEEEKLHGMSYLRDYYAFTGPFAQKIAEGLLTTPQAIAQYLRGYAEAGCDEVILFPTVPRIEQVERLAKVLQGLGYANSHTVARKGEEVGW